MTSNFNKIKIDESKMDDIRTLLNMCLIKPDPFLKKLKKLEEGDRDLFLALFIQEFRKAVIKKSLMQTMLNLYSICHQAFPFFMKKTTETEILTLSKSVADYLFRKFKSLSDVITSDKYSRKKVDYKNWKSHEDLDYLIANITLYTADLYRTEQANKYEEIKSLGILLITFILLREANHIKSKEELNSNSSIWQDTFLIRIITESVQNLIYAISDDRIKKVIHQTSGYEKKKSVDPWRKLKTRIKEEARFIWKKDKEKTRKQVAEEIYNKLLKKISGLSYPKFSRADEISPEDVKQIFENVYKHEYKKYYESFENDTARLNYLVELPSLFDQVEEGYPHTKSSPLVEETKDLRNLNYFKLNDSGKSKIGELNRWILKIISDGSISDKTSFSYPFTQKMVSREIYSVAKEFGH